MRTMIQGGWVVGYNGSGHELIPNGCVVFEDDRVVHVGPTLRRTRSTAASTPPASSSSPGLINCHLHAATNAGQAVFLDGLKADYFGSNFVGYVAPRRGAAMPRGGDRADVAGTYGLWSALRAGATTIMDVGTMPGGPARLHQDRRRARRPRLRGPGVPLSELRVRRQPDRLGMGRGRRRRRARARRRLHQGARRRLQRPHQGDALSRASSTPARPSYSGRRAVGRTTWASRCSSTPR